MPRSSDMALCRAPANAGRIASWTGARGEMKPYLCNDVFAGQLEARLVQAGSGCEWLPKPSVTGWNGRCKRRCGTSKQAVLKPEPILV